MSIEISMPRLSDTMEAGTLVKWYVKEGDTVKADQVLADVETDKATMEMPTYDAGTVAKVLIPEGKQVSVGETLMVLAEEGEDPKEVASKYAADASSSKSEKKSEKSKDSDSGNQKRESASSTATMEPPAESHSEPSSNGSAGKGRVLISPLARKLADDHGINVSTVRGSGPHGRVVKRDILELVESGSPSRAAAAPASASTAPAPAVASESIFKLGQTVSLSNMRQTIARRLIASKTQIPHYQVSMQVNMDPLLDLRETLNEQLEPQGVKLSVNDFLIRAGALAIHRHPIINAAWGESELKISERVNVGMAVSLPEERGGGLVVATIYDADRKGLRQISAESKALAEKARSRGLTADEMGNTTFTISNLGMFGVDFFTAIINPPNAAILAVGAAMKKPVVRNDELTVGHEMSLTFSFDHRIVDGATGAEFARTLKEMLERPAALLV